MKTATVILLATSTAFAATSVYLTQRAREDRSVVLKTQTERTELTARVKQLERERAELVREVQSLRAVPAEGPAPRAPSRAPVSANEPDAAVFTVMGSGPDGPRGFRGNSFQPPPMTPAMRTLMRKQMRQHVERNYEDVGEELGLTEAQSRKLLDLIVDTQTFESFSNADSPESLRKKMQDRKRQRETDLAALLGPDKTTQLAEYEKTLSARSELGQLQEQLAAMEVPMQAEQRKQMLKGIVEDQQRNPQPAFAPGVAPEDYRAQYNAYEDERQERLYENARGALTSEQLKVVREYQDYQKQMRQRFALMPPPSFVPGRATAIQGTIAVPAPAPRP